MARELITSWADYQTAVDRLLAIACQTICIYDEDMATLKLETPSHLAAIKRILQAGHDDALRIAVRNATPTRQQHPKLQQLLTAYSHLAKVRETPAQLAHLRDSMLIVDGKYALIRFERDLPRSKLLIDEAEELRPYLIRFREIWSDGGEEIPTSTLGL